MVIVCTSEAIEEDFNTFTPASIHCIFSDLFTDFWRGYVRGVRDYLGEMLGGFYMKKVGKMGGKKLFPETIRQKWGGKNVSNSIR